jgi:thioredoxin 1
LDKTLERYGDKLYNKAIKEGVMEMVEVTQENFDKEVVKSEKPVLVDFWAPWCMPCKIIAPSVEKIADEMKDEIRVMKANIDESPEIATELSILNIPTLVLFKDGQELARIIGVNSKEAIEKKIKSLI